MTYATDYRDRHFLDFCTRLKTAQPSPSYATDIKPLLKCELRHMDGSRWVTTWFESSLNRWSWIVEQTCEEFGCTEDQVSCIDGLQDPDDYEGCDARRDKIAIDGKAVGYVT